jgi:hypothetical protein
LPLCNVRLSAHGYVNMVASPHHVDVNIIVDAGKRS